MKLKSSSKALRQYNYLLDVIDYINMTKQAKQNIIANTNNLIDAMAEDFENEKKKIKTAKHLQIGDVFFTIDGFKVCCQKVRAIALQPDNSIIYNWKYRDDAIFLNLSDVEKTLNKYMNDALEKAMNDITKGGE